MMSESVLPAGSRVWAYLRVSSEDQAERGTPIADQRAEVLRYCDEDSLVLTRWFVDEARQSPDYVWLNTRLACARVRRARSEIRLSKKPMT